MKKIFKQNTGIGDKLKNAVAELSVDIFGYEKIVAKNILENTNFLSQKLKLSKEHLYVKILQKDHVIQAFLYNQSIAVQALPIDELAYFFVNRESGNLASIQNKIAFSIKNYLSELAKKHQIHQNNLYVLINIKNDVVIINAYSNSEFIQNISLKSLIKFFK